MTSRPLFEIHWRGVEAAARDRVGGAMGGPLLEIEDPRSLEIVSDLLSTDAVRVSRGDPVLVEQWGGPQPLEGRVRLVEPSGFMTVSALGVEEQRVNVIVDFDDEVEPASLGDGYRAEVRIVRRRDAAVLKVPVGALFRRGDGWAVFVVGGERARLHPPDRLQDGAPVRLRPSNELKTTGAGQ